MAEYIRDTPVQVGYRPVLAPQSPATAPVVSQHHVINTEPHRAFNKARWIPWIVLVVLFVLSPLFTVIALVIYGFLFGMFMTIGWAGGRRV